MLGKVRWAKMSPVLFVLDSGETFTCDLPKIIGQATYYVMSLCITTMYLLYQCKFMWANVGRGLCSPSCIYVRLAVTFVYVCIFRTVSDTQISAFAQKIDQGRRCKQHKSIQIILKHCKTLMVPLGEPYPS